MVKKEYKDPNVKAPRFRQEAVNVADRAFIKTLKEKYPKYKTLTETEIRKIIKTFNETVWKEVIETRDGVQLPEGLGVLFIGTCPAPIKENIDFAKSKKYGMTVTNKNWETDGKLAKIFYTSYTSKIKFVNRECWSFTPCRNFKRAVAKAYPENWTMYIEVSHDKKLRKTYDKIRYRDFHKGTLEKKLKDYNEFDL